MTNGREVIPSRWNYRKISEVTTKVGSGSTPRGGESVYQDSGVPLIRSMNVHSSGFKSDGLAFIDADEAKKLDHVIVQPSDVLLNITGASIGRVTTAPDVLAGARVNQHVCIIRPKEELSSSFLSYFLASPKEQARVMNVQVGATRQALTKAMILDWDVPVPPFHEQREIVAEIEKQFSRLDEAVVLLKRTKANLKRYKAAVLKAAVEGKLTENWRKQHPDVEPASKLLERILAERRAKWGDRGKYRPSKEAENGELPSLPHSWIWTTVDQLTWMVTSGSRGWGDYYSDTGPLFIRAQDIKTDSLNLETVARVRIPKNAEGTRTAVSIGDVLITITGANVTKSALVKRLSEQAFVSQHVALLKPCLAVVSPYLFNWIVSPAHGRRTLEGWAYGAGKPGLSLEQVRSLPVAFPPEAEQKQIVAEVERRLSVIEGLEATIEANLTRADRLRQAILSQAFSGRLVAGVKSGRAPVMEELPVAAEPLAHYRTSR